MAFGVDMMSLPGDSLGISPDLYNKKCRDMGKFCEHHDRDHFLPIPPSAPQFIEGTVLGLRSGELPPQEANGKPT